MKARLKEHYLKTVVPALIKEFGYGNPMAVPKLQKISVNIGMGEATQNPKLMDPALATRFVGNGVVVFFGLAKPVRTPLIGPPLVP